MQGPHFLGTKFFEDQISKGPKISGAQMRSETISVHKCSTERLQTLPFSEPTHKILLLT